MPVLVAVLGAAVSSDRAVGSGCPGSGQQSVGADVIVGRVAQLQGTNQVQNYTITSSGAGIKDCVSWGTTSCNLGTVPLDWLAAPNTNHPVIGQNLFRLKPISGANRFEHIGQSWLKHGFAALSENACCASCTGDFSQTHLGVGCSDPYTAFRNGGQASAGPKFQVNATTGIHIHPPANPGYTSGVGSVDRRLQVYLSDLEVSDGTGPTKYFAECQYVSADDAANGHKANNASWRPTQVSGASPNYSFAVNGDQDVQTRREQPAIMAWKEFEPTVTITNIVTPENANADPDLTVATVILGAKATDLGGGIWHYEYAIQNLDSDRSIGYFFVPVSNYVTVTNIGFHDVEYNNGDGVGSVTTDGTNWPGVQAVGNVAWSTVQTFAVNPNGNAIRWGTLYNFRFDANIEPHGSLVNATLGQFKVVNNLSAATVVPSTLVTCTKADVDGNSLFDGNDITLFTKFFVNSAGITPSQKCACDCEVVTDFSIDSDDVEPFVACILNDGCL
jgi:hypothetical protein